MIKVIELNSIGELIDFPFVEGIKDKKNFRRMSYTFRGQKSEKYSLTSGLRRTSQKDFNYLERRLLNNFKKYGQIIEDKICRSIWENMIIAQHHGIPTRCLDFSLSPIVALHFALTENSYGENAVVWAINHGFIHRNLLPGRYKKILEYNEAVSFTVDMLEELNISINDYNQDMENKSFIFLEPPSIDNRIVNQFSHLAIIPDALDPLDDFLSGIPFEKIVYKFIIPYDKIDLFRKQLDYMNITERTLFPGLDGLASYLKRRYGYGR
ncbi:MAG: FRG domain-containing protein [Bacilli bacterium]|nr:FRG domain-containing protein [Bacilli bacterium]